MVETNSDKPRLPKLSQGLADLLIAMAEDTEVAKTMTPQLIEAINGRRFEITPDTESNQDL